MVYIGYGGYLQKDFNKWKKSLWHFFGTLFSYPSKY